MQADLAVGDFVSGAATWLGTVDDSTLRDLTAVFRESPGYYPTTLFPLWQAEIIRRGLSGSNCVPCPQPASLPSGHLADCDWRFLPSTVSRLLDGKYSAMAW
jgi:hypothetical protein